MPGDRFNAFTIVRVEALIYVGRVYILKLQGGPNTINGKGPY